MVTGTENRRSHNRVKKFLGPQVDLDFQEHGERRQIRARVVDSSDVGMGLAGLSPIAPGTHITFQSPDTGKITHGKITRCHRMPAGDYRIGLSLGDPAAEEHTAQDVDGEDLYEILQVNPKADTDTIHRLYRVLAQRYHPDNSETGDAQLFRQVMKAYSTLTDPEKRAAYDVRAQSIRRQTFKVFEAPAQSVGTTGEKQKRRAMLTALYMKRMRDSNTPALSMTELEQLLDIPKEHLEFALWYLKESGLVMRSDNNRVTITVRGVDALEATGDPLAQLITRSDRLLDSAGTKKPEAVPFG